MRKTIIAGNWKMHKTIKEGQELVVVLRRELYQVENLDIVVCPPYTLLSYLADALETSNIAVGAQDVYWQDEGAFTGEISGKMLKDAGCSFVIIGHSERRQFFGETNESVNKKLKAALAIGLTPIVCVGEVLKEREAGKTLDVLKDHIEGALSGISVEDALKIVIAYEPVWAIGTGKTATPAQAQEAHKYIRALLLKLYNQEVASYLRIQYGGSVKPDNIAELMKQPDVDGALVGGASLEAVSFSEIVKKAAEVLK
ncbi:MAG: triose-phosphate isomerase [Candidatus Omnitrophica bacterium CG23_combo_of_CG06-09_8_20_14_all_41_10]|uniref:Triosephosphate isomerase n=1 Tax=Candidatus Sherwoodlollariibacterium unditelluris TaxID=1974757 RepID=A0A2G9YKS7_9BACT|nr:MAG: triose-phosphate isomerase [Candidatus Omnitrophica bacterium CG23_combo_of_CG06-09_8_20_14_all_41_10]